MIYFIHLAKHRQIKIGYTLSTDSLKQRMELLGMANPEPLELLGVLDGAIRQEKSLHHQFRHLRVKGEWFRATEELTTYIKDHTRKVQFPVVHRRRPRIKTTNRYKARKQAAADTIQRLLKWGHSYESIARAIGGASSRSVYRWFKQHNPPLPSLQRALQALFDREKKRK